jgi:hypothetical protein
VKTSARVEPEQLRSLVVAYRKALGDLDGTIDSNPLLVARFTAAVIDAGKRLTAPLLSMKEVPAGRAKTFEMAVRLIDMIQRSPRDPAAWYRKNRDKLWFLALADAWADKRDDVETLQTFRLEGFTVHNTLGLTEKELTAVKLSIQKAAAGIRNLRVPGIEKVLYGDLHLVAKLSKGGTLAWYHPSNDDVFVRPTKNVGHDEVESLIHELGHRYIHKFIGREQYRKWIEWHYNVGQGPTELPKLVPGDHLPVKVRGLVQPTIVSVVPGVRVTLSTGGSVEWRELVKVFRANAEATRYPTRYAAKDQDEHFCEALALRATGTLKSPHLENFQQIFEGAVMPTNTVEVTKFAASTYVQISREELEGWLDKLPLAERWYRLAGKASIYMLPLSKNVAVKLSSTIGTADDAMGRGQASMQLALVSRLVILPYGPMVLNKKAQGQSHFARTLNWETNWRTGVERMKDAYVKAAGFYDALAEIENRDRYKEGLLARIEAIPGWRNHRVVADFHGRVTQGGILMASQMDLLSKAERAGEKVIPVPVDARTDAMDDLLARMRLLYVKARAHNDVWLTGFVESLGVAIKAGKVPSPKQQAILDKSFAKYSL